MCFKLYSKSQGRNQLSKKQEIRNKVKVGKPAPSFTLLDQGGQLVNLKDYLGKSTIVLYFYPKDNSPGCTTQACTFHDQYEVFKEHGAVVIGISSDSVESHKDFAAKYYLPFTILSDQRGTIRELYNIKQSLGLIPGRVTFIIDKKGIIRYIFSSQLHVKEHVDKSLKILLEIESEEKPKASDLEIRF